jgi:hypothetical protein
MRETPLERAAPLTQYGDTWDQGFRCRPRASDLDGVSVLLGRLTLAQAARYVRRDGRARRGDAVRYTEVGCLEDEGFVVVHTPTRRNPLHVSVQSPPGWDDDVCERFHRCFGQPEVG